MARRDRAAKGSANPAAKLREEEVREIHDLYGREEMTQAELEERYGVS